MAHVTLHRAMARPLEAGMLTAAWEDGPPSQEAADRRAELRSDLWEQAAASDARGQRSVRLALSVPARALTGMPADLSWRAAVLSGALERSDGIEDVPDDCTDLVGRAIASATVTSGAFGGGLSG